MFELSRYRGEMREGANRDSGFSRRSRGGAEDDGVAFWRRVLASLPRGSTQGAAREHAGRSEGADDDEVPVLRSTRCPEWDRRRQQSELAPTRSPSKEIGSEGDYDLEHDRSRPTDPLRLQLGYDPRSRMATGQLGYTF